jgi:hypothetical protein
VSGQPGELFRHRLDARSRMAVLAAARNIVGGCISLFVAGGNGRNQEAKIGVSPIRPAAGSRNTGRLAFSLAKAAGALMILSATSSERVLRERNVMKTTAAVLVMLLCCIAPVSAQSLDIAGVGFTLGSNAESAVGRLTPHSRVLVDSACDGCGRGTYRLSAMGKPSGGLQGVLFVTKYRITSITKFHDISTGDPRKAYTDALRELREQGGSECTMRTLTLNSDGDSTISYVATYAETGSRTVARGDFISKIETRCGMYRMLLELPSSPRSAFGLSIELASAAP